MTLQSERDRVLTRPLAAVASASALLVLLALGSLVSALVRLAGAISMSAESIARGVSLPAAAFDGVSTGTLNLGRMLLTNMYDGNDVPMPAALAFAAELRAVVVPYRAAEAVNAALVVTLAVVVLLLCLRLVRGLPFVRHVTLSLAAFAVILAVFSVASQVVRRIPFSDADAGWSMRKDLASFIVTLQLPPTEGSIVDDSFTYTPEGMPLALDLTLVGVAVLIGLVAAAFAIGQRMQRDTMDLV